VSLTKFQLRQKKWIEKKVTLRRTSFCRPNRTDKVLGLVDGHRQPSSASRAFCASSNVLY
jgi:hypothetical protein